VKRLVARAEAEAPVPSLSANHGLGQFPPHTDGAENVEPPRYVALWSPAKHKVATLLYDGKDPLLDRPLFSRAWLAGFGRRRFYVVPRQTDGDTVRWRLNPDCMRPTSSDDHLREGLACFETLSRTRVEWQPKQALIFDNARVLHGREALSRENSERELMRVSIYR
jgi:TfdA family taurine catabolism dioxygenase TauD